MIYDKLLHNKIIIQYFIKMNSLLYYAMQIFVFFLII